MNNENRKKESRKYCIPVNGKYYETTKEIYDAYYKMDRRERYLEERDLKKNVVNFTGIGNDSYSAEEIISDENIDIEEEVTNKIMIEAVLEAITILEKEEKWLIQELFFCGKSEVELARESGVARTTIQSRKYKILSKIKKLIKY